MENKEIENRQLLNPNQQDNWPETLKNPIYTPAFLREQIGKLMRVEFLIGTNNLVDRIGVLEDVGASYILLRSFENDSLVYCDNKIYHNINNRNICKLSANGQI